MLYNQPFDQPASPNAAYVNGNPATGTPGSIPPAAAIEYPQREIVNFINNSGITAANSDLQQLSKGVQNGVVMFGLDIGTANAMVAVFTPAIQVLYPGMTVRIKKGASPNTGATTLDVGTGANAVHRASLANLNSGDLPASTIAELSWDGTAWQITNFQGFNVTSTTVNNFVTDVPYAADSGSTNNIVATFSPAITSLTAGLMVIVKLANNITGGATFTANSTGTITIVRPEGAGTVNGDAVAGQMLTLIYTGSLWMIAGRSYFRAAYYNAAGTYSWTAPSGVFNVKARLKGGGGGGGSTPRSGGLYGACGGGGGLCEGLFQVSPGTAYTIVIGAGGAGQTSTSGGNGSAGGTTSFSPFCSASGGGGGAGQGSGTLVGGFTGFGSGGFNNSGLGDGSTGGVLSTVNANLIAPGCGGGPGGQSGAGSGQPGYPGRGPGGGGGGTSLCETGSQGGNGAPGECLLEYI